MNDLMPTPAYAIYRDSWQGKLRWQAYHILANVEFEVEIEGGILSWIEFELPIASPVTSRADAELDCLSDWRERGNLGPVIIEGRDRRFNWTTLRRYIQ